MMKFIEASLLFSLIFFTSCKFEDNYLMEMKQLDFDYKVDTGTGVMEFSYAPKEESGSPRLSIMNFRVEKQNTSLKIMLPGITYVMKDAPQSLLEAEDIILSDINVKTDTLDTSVQLGQLYQRGKSSDMLIEDLKATCKGKDTATDITERFIHNCLKYLQGNLYKFEDGTSDLKIMHGDLSVRNGRLRLNAKIFTDINGKVKLEGHADYDDNSDVLRIRVDKAKFGIISLKKRLFKELQKQQSDSFKVRNPYIYITL
jgi:hypothetical protein